MGGVSSAVKEARQNLLALNNSPFLPAYSYCENGCCSEKCVFVFLSLNCHRRTLSLCRSHSVRVCVRERRAAPLAIQIPCKLYWESCRRTDMTCGLHTHTRGLRQLPLPMWSLARFSRDVRRLPALPAARALHLITLIYMSAASPSSSYRLSRCIIFSSELADGEQNNAMK